MAKKIILFILLLIPFIGIGQGEKDTIPVVMLVCDTSTTNVRYCCKVDTLKDNLGGETILLKVGYKDVYSYGVSWQFGYEVRQRHKDFYYVDGRLEDYFTHVEYLDENKKQLSKNIIVWQHKNR